MEIVEGPRFPKAVVRMSDMMLNRLLLFTPTFLYCKEASAIYSGSLLMPLHVRF